MDLLRNLQALDEEAALLQAQKKLLLGRKEGALKRLKAAELKAAEESEQVKKRKMRIDKLDVELRTKDEKVQRLNVQLNTAKTNKEYSALQHEIATIKADASVLEDEMLSLMEENDSQAKRQVERDKGLEKAQSELQAVEDEISRRSKEVDDAVEELKQRRQKLLNELDGQLKATYERLMRSKVGKAVVRAPLADRSGDDRICSGCYMRLTSNTTSMLMRGDLLVRCHSCGRILFIDDEQDNQESNSAPTSEPQPA